MSENDSGFNEKRATAAQRIKSLERLEALYRLREQARESDRKAMLKSIEDLIVIERKSYSRDADAEPA